MKRILFIILMILSVSCNSKEPKKEVDGMGDIGLSIKNVDMNYTGGELVINTKFPYRYIDVRISDQPDIKEKEINGSTVYLGEWFVIKKISDKIFSLHVSQNESCTQRSTELSISFCDKAGILYINQQGKPKDQCE